MKTLNEMFYEVILQNELSGNISAALKFSDPDGVLSGKSGWSFGVSQFDTRNNTMSHDCLRECGFSDDEIHGVIDQTINVKPLAAKLAAHADVIACYDEAQLAHCLHQAATAKLDNKLLVENPSGILALADYINQYGSIGPQFVKWMQGLGHPVTAADVLTWKLEHTKYGREHPKDCRRRYEGIMKVIKASAGD